MDKGFFARNGLTVTPRPPSGVSDALTLVGAGRADVGISYEPELFFAQEHHAPVAAVATVVPTALASIIAAGIERHPHAGRPAREDDRRRRHPEHRRVRRQGARERRPRRRRRPPRRRQVQPGPGTPRPQGRCGRRRVPEHRGSALRDARPAPGRLPVRPLRRARHTTSSWWSRTPTGCATTRAIAATVRRVRRRPRRRHGLGQGPPERRGRGDARPFRRRLPERPRAERPRHPPPARHRAAARGRVGPVRRLDVQVGSARRPGPTRRRSSPDPRLRARWIRSRGSF